MNVMRALGDRRGARIGIAGLWLAVILFGVNLTGALEAAAQSSLSETTLRLFAAVERNDLPETQASIALGADVFARNAKGQTPTELAVDHGRVIVAHGSRANRMEMGMAALLNVVIDSVLGFAVRPWFQFFAAVPIERRLGVEVPGQAYRAALTLPVFRGCQIVVEDPRRRRWIIRRQCDAAPACRAQLAPADAITMARHDAGS